MRCTSRPWLVATLTLAGCTASGPQVNEYLDPQTAVTIRALAVPLVYAHDAPAIAANTRDYLSLGVVEVNNMGTRKHYLAVVSWTTIDRHRVGVPPAPVPERVEMSIGGHARDLKPVSHEARSLGIGGALFRPPSGYVGEAWYAMTPADLRALAAELPDSVTILQDDGDVAYHSWRGDKPAFVEFVRDIPEPVRSDPSGR